MKKIFILLLAGLLLTGCGNSETPDNISNQQGDNITKEDDKDDKGNLSGTDKDEKLDDLAGYAFEYNNVIIPMNEEAAPIVETLGKPMEYFEAPSCAFQGLDKTYYYNGFEIVTYPMDGVDYVSSVNLLDDSVTTNENIYIGANISEVIAAYGDDYKQEEGFYTYTLGDSYIQFITENDVVTNITYFAITE